jgi:hypothetical protein
LRRSPGGVYEDLEGLTRTSPRTQGGVLRGLQEEDCPPKAFEGLAEEEDCKDSYEDLGGLDRTPEDSKEDFEDSAGGLRRTPRRSKEDWARSPIQVL